MHLLRQYMISPPSSDLLAWGLAFLRITVGLLIFYVHGWHKLKGGIAHVRTGARWQLAEEVAEMHFPAPVAQAFAATIVQFVCSLGLIAGLLTRLDAFMLAGTLGVAILQNILTRRDPQLPILYVLVMVTLLLLGGGAFSLDALLWSRT